jgi:mRNA interferase MazF
MGVEVKRFDVFIVTLDPVIGSEISKARPAVVISPNELNDNIRTVIIAPMTTSQRRYRSRVACVFEGKGGQVALDQLRAVDKSRLVKRVGALSRSEQKAVLSTLQALFAE